MFLDHVQPKLCPTLSEGGKGEAVILRNNFQGMAHIIRYEVLICRYVTWIKCIFPCPFKRSSELTLGRFLTIVIMTVAVSARQ